MTRILVTGGAGYIGSVTLRHLLARVDPPSRIVVLDNLSRGHRAALPPGVDLAQVDLLDARAVDHVMSQGFDGVIHFAGVAYVGESTLDPGLYFRTNVTGTIHLLDAMARHGCKCLVVSSSCAVYGQPPALPITEEMIPHPANPYGCSKWMMEQLLPWYQAAHGLRSVVLRYFNAAGAGYGAGSRHDPETRLIPLTLFAAMGRTGPLNILGNDYSTPDGTCLRDYVHVQDLARAHDLALRHLLAEGPSRLYNLGTGQAFSVRDIVSMVERVTGLAVPTRVAARRAGDPPHLVADPGRAAQELGWKAQLGLEQMVRSAWDWHGAV